MITGIGKHMREEFRQFIETFWSQIIVVVGAIWLLVKWLLSFYYDMRKDTQAIQQMERQCNERTHKVDRQLHTIYRTMQDQTKVLNEMNQRVSFLYGYIQRKEAISDDDHK